MALRSNIHKNVQVNYQKVSSIIMWILRWKRVLVCYIAIFVYIYVFCFLSGYVFITLYGKVHAGITPFPRKPYTRWLQYCITSNAVQIYILRKITTTGNKVPPKCTLPTCIILDKVFTRGLYACDILKLIFIDLL